MSVTNAAISNKIMCIAVMCMNRTACFCRSVELLQCAIGARAMDRTPRGIPKNTKTQRGKKTTDQSVMMSIKRMTRREENSPRIVSCVIIFIRL